MITAILETMENEVVGIAAKAGNEKFLIGNGPAFSKLSLLSEIDYDIFASVDMPDLIGELEILRNTVSDGDQSHIDEITDLAIRCRDEQGLILTFTPFE